MRAPFGTGPILLSNLNIAHLNMFCLLTEQPESQFILHITQIVEVKNAVMHETDNSIYAGQTTNVCLLTAIPHCLMTRWCCSICSVVQYTNSVSFK